MFDTAVSRLTLAVCMLQIRYYKPIGVIHLM